ncbi:alpha/beta fold hydrolase [Sorangium sp. So ce1036]|uniref:alpha/beta fold hydrolase n=1 Tax=Sorangium sp. So ce1036 TaxID=3133328 RepID=UPI003F0318AA
MTTMFRDEQARATIEAAYERFRARVPGTSARTVATRFGDTHVLLAGRADAPPLVVLHGALASSAHVMGELGPLRDRFRVIAPDVIGQSVKSADARLPLDGPAYGEWLVDVLDALGLARPHVYGVSWGGFVARKLAELAPERIDRLVLLVPAGVVAGSAWRGFIEVGIPMALYRAFPSEARLRRLARPLFTTTDDGWVPYFGEAIRSYRLDFRVPPLATPGPLARFTRPTLVFGASDDLSFPGQALLARVRALIPHAETELLEGSRHAPPTDDAFRRRLGDRITRFLLAGGAAELAAPAGA